MDLWRTVRPGRMIFNKKEMDECGECLLDLFVLNSLCEIKSSTDYERMVLHG